MLRCSVFVRIVVVAAVFQNGASGFMTAPSRRTSLITTLPQSSPSSRLFLAKGGKGFGTEPASSTTRSKPAPTFNEESDRTAENPYAEQNAGQKALEDMRRERAEKRDAELRKVKEMRLQDSLVKEEAAVIPEQVAQRMGKRMLPFVGIPLFGGMGSFVLFWYLATYKNMEFQPALVAGTTIALLVFGLLGITYSMMSASWDPEREGSALGVDEFGRNVKNLREGLSRSRENALLREKLAGMSEQEIEAAIRDLDKRDEKKRKQMEGRLEELRELSKQEEDS